MEISFWHQLALPFLSLVFGLVAGVLYDAVRIFRCCLGIKYTDSTPEYLSKIKLPLLSREKREKRMGAAKESIIMGITDILYFAVLTVLMCIFLYAVNKGIVRWYIYLFCFLGFFVYYFTAGKFVIKISSVIVFFIRAFFAYIMLFILSPIVYSTRLILKIISQRRIRNKHTRRTDERGNSRSILISSGREAKS